MRNTLKALVVGVLLGFGPLLSDANATTISLAASWSGSFNWWTGGGSWNDNIVRSYSSPFFGSRIDGYIGFDLSAIPDAANVTALSLGTYTYSFPGTVGSASSVFQSSDTSWVRGTTGAPSGSMVQLSGPQTFTGGSQQLYTWALDSSLVNWTSAFLSNELSLVLRNTDYSTYNYNYWYGSDAGPYIPTLTITYEEATVPAPGAIALLGIGLMGIGALRRKKAA